MFLTSCGWHSEAVFQHCLPGAVQSADMYWYMQDQFESHDAHEGMVGNGSLSTCSSLPASEDAYALAEGCDADGAGRHSNSAPFLSISERRSPGMEGHEPDGKDSRQASHEAQWQRMAYVANGWAEKRNGTAPLPPLQNGNFSAAVSPERQVSPGEWPPGLPASRSEGLLSEWTRGSFGSHSGKLFGLEASYSSEDLLAAFQTELDRSPRKLAKASNGSSEAAGAHLGQPTCRHDHSLSCAQHPLVQQCLLMCVGWCQKVSMMCSVSQALTDVKLISENSTLPGCTCRSGKDSGDAVLTPADVNSCLESIAGPDAVKEPELVLVSMHAILTQPSPLPCCNTLANLHAPAR